MLKKTLVALCATTVLLSAGAALADKPGAGWITIEKAIETAKTKAGYTEVYAAEADDNGYWEVKGRKADGVVYEARIEGTSGNILRDRKD
ncbi:PepSY domain-containing protein [Pseudomonas costantinii]|uniref:PepSY domain-containing protein n=1 Tax=Pseudomonas costantinii TaxID=168469 RepID=UPI0015A2A8A9|nr:PepSY domain-containing protein [Pseudomonas costantinii]NVZ71291.1 PepSY domain-containing protein [Pseudomonas costantinii]